MRNIIAIFSFVLFFACTKKVKDKNIHIEPFKILYLGEYSKINSKDLEIYFETEGFKGEKFIIEKGTFIESTNDSIYRGFRDTLLLKPGRLKVSFDKDFIPGYITFHTLNENLQDYEFFVYSNSNKKFDKTGSKKYIYIK